MRNFLKYNWPSILWAAFVLVICLMPGSNVPKIKIPHFDKVVHVSIYMVLGLVTYYGWIMQVQFSSLRTRTVMKVMLVLALYGLTIEVMQGTLTADRSFDLWDALANSVGAVIGTYAGKVIFK
jgi:VanZ family protein